MFVDVRTGFIVVVISEIDNATVKVKRQKDNVVYKIPKKDLKRID